MACDSRAGLEAQKLISISLGKMAASRVGRTGASLHKSLLVASVLHRARHVFLEESYHVHRAAHPEAYTQPPAAPPSPPVVTVYAPLLAPAPAATPATPSPPTSTNEDNSDTEDKENRVCEKQQQLEQQIAEGGRAPLCENSSNSRVAALKRRRCVSQQETQEAVWSILPKRPRTATPEPRTITTPEPRTSPTPESAPEHDDSDSCGNSMEVEHITSLVSIFSFGGQRVDLCGAQAAREDLAQYQPVALAV